MYKRQLLVPYFVSCAGIVIASIFFESLVTLLKDNKAVFILNIQKWVRAAFIGLGYHAELWQTSLPAIGPIWFLLALFWALLLLELYKRTKYPMACAIGVSFLSLALHHFSGFRGQYKKEWWLAFLRQWVDVYKRQYIR